METEPCSNGAPPVAFSPGSIASDATMGTADDPAQPAILHEPGTGVPSKEDVHVGDPEAASATDFSEFPSVLLQFKMWIQLQGKPPNTADIYANHISAHFKYWKKSLASMGRPGYIDWVKGRAKETTSRYNVNQGTALGSFSQFWPTKVSPIETSSSVSCLPSSTIDAAVDDTDPSAVGAKLATAEPPEKEPDAATSIDTANLDIVLEQFKAWAKNEGKSVSSADTYARYLANHFSQWNKSLTSMARPRYLEWVKSHSKKTGAKFNVHHGTAIASFSSFWAQSATNSETICLYLELKSEVKLLKKAGRKKVKQSDKKSFKTSIKSKFRAPGGSKSEGAPTAELKAELKVELKPEGGCKSEGASTAELKAELKVELKSELRSELLEELRKELKKELRSEFKKELLSELQDMHAD